MLGVAVGQSQYPTPTGALRDHREAAQPVVVSAELGLGRGREARAARARATRSARAGWASRRRASACTARPTRPRSATARRTAASACASRTPSGCSCTCASAAPCGSSTRPFRESASRAPRGGGMTDHPCCETRALSLGDRAAARARRALRLAARPSRRQRVPRRAARGTSPQAPAFDLPRLDSPRHDLVAGRSRGTPRCSTSGPRGARPAPTRRPT